MATTLQESIIHHYSDLLHHLLLLIGWKAKINEKTKIFMWLIFKERLYSKNLLRKRNYKIKEENYNCVLCSLNLEETTYHLIFECPQSDSLT